MAKKIYLKYFNTSLMSSFFLIGVRHRKHGIYLLRIWSCKILCKKWWFHSTLLWSKFGYVFSAYNLRNWGEVKKKIVHPNKSIYWDFYKGLKIKKKGGDPLPPSSHLPPSRWSSLPPPSSLDATSVTASAPWVSSPVPWGHFNLAVNGDISTLLTHLEIICLTDNGF